MNLSELLKGCDVAGITGDPSVEISRVTADSREADKGSLFVSIRGERNDGHDFIDEVVRRGVAAVMVDAASKVSASPGVAVVFVPDCRKSLGLVAANFYGNPSRRLRLTGITGTNGKTTTSYLLESIMEAADYSAGVIGTVNYRYAGRTLSAARTTPDPVALQGLLADMADSGVSHCIMEVSSHALDQQRVAGTNFDTAIFTNLTRDHLDYHGTMEDYGRSKEILFLDLPGRDKKAVVNIDDTFGRALSKKVESLISYGITEGDISPIDVVSDERGMKLRLRSPVGDLEISSSLVGEHNLYNIMAAIGGAVAEGVGKGAIKRGVESLANVPGRLERVTLPVSWKGCRAFVDYAHTPDALERAIKALRPTTRGRLITLFGCGGDRDREKRAIMGEVSAAGSDFTVITSDNPRSEEPLSIIGEIEKGVIAGGGEKGKNYKVVADRREAIMETAGMIRSGDTLLIAGKGHEDYQVVGEKKSFFDDRVEAKKAFESAVPGAEGDR